eukprot:13485390-Ditylum_brightwellii.AAC.1
MPGGTGLFSPLQQAMANDPPFTTITPFIQQALHDWCTILKQLERIPTYVKQLIPNTPNYIGYIDACKLGTGGVWCPGMDDLDYVVWQVQFPPDIQTLMHSDNHPGMLTINNLELSGIVLGYLCLEHIALSLKHKHISLHCDNTSAVAWATKLCISTSTPAAQLLPPLGLRIHVAKASPLSTIHIAGENNHMADISSQAF